MEHSIRIESVMERRSFRGSAMLPRFPHTAVSHAISLPSLSSLTPAVCSSACLWVMCDLSPRSTVGRRNMLYAETYVRKLSD